MIIDCKWIVGKKLCSACHMREERLYEISKGLRTKNGFGKI